MKFKGIIIVFSIFAIILISASAYIVDETEQVVITQFGKIIGEAKTKPGLKFKVPFIQNVMRYPKNLLQWDGEPGQIPTKEKKYIQVDSFARWKIVDCIKFLESIGATTVEESIRRANLKLNDIIDPAVRNFITSNRLIETVRRTNRPLELKIDEEKDKYIDTDYNITIGREKIMSDIMNQAQPKLNKFGIELVDVKIKRINYEITTRKFAYNRMIAERKQIAEKFRSEGKGEAQKIIGEKERELKLITSEAYKKAQEVKGKADAEAIKILAASFGLDPDFYSFIQTLEIYGTALEKNTSLILSTDSELFKYFKGYSDKNYHETP